MRRREFITLLSGAAAAPSTLWPLPARAQQPAMPVVGFLGSSSAQVTVKNLEALHKGLRETGYVEGRNVAIEFRWAGGREDRMPELAADLVRRQVAVIAVPVSTAGALAAKAATSTIPIVFGTGSDPVALGLVASLNRPGGNATGVMSLNVELTAKRLGLLRELAPQATRLVALVSPNAAMTDAIVKDVHASIPTLGVPVEILYAGYSDRDIEAAFANLSQKPGAALLVTVDPFFFNRRALIVALAARHALPTVYFTREFAEIGGLLSYGTSLSNRHELTGIYTGRVLKGEKPADLPVAQPTKFDMVINLSTAKALAIDVPPTLLALADEVIE
jgi:putative tryptophan/tyrosine transport system substrate-binding protein